MGSELGVNPDSKPQASYDPVSIWWATWAAVWTCAVASGMAFLVIRRQSPVLRVRGIWLSFAAIVFLHLYWASVQFGTMIGAIMPGDAQYWIMGLWLPWGIALFHAYNTRFLHVAKQQKKYAHPDHRPFRPMPLPLDSKGKGSLMARFRALDYNTRTLIVVGIAMVFQLFLTILMWLISRKWHRTWGIPGTEVHGTPMEQLTAMGQGWEWYGLRSW